MEGCARLLFYGVGCIAEMFLKCMREMGKVFKACFKINIDGFTVFFPDLIVCQLQSSFC